MRIVVSFVLALSISAGLALAQTRPATASATRPATRPAPKKIWRNGDKLQVKWGAHWDDATVVRPQGDWTLVEYTRMKQREWVEPWRIREPGSKEDPLPYVQPNGMVMRNEGPPRPKPGPMP